MSMGISSLIAEIEESGPEDDYYDAKVTVLSEMSKHPVKEEEKPDGMFAKALSRRWTCTYWESSWLRERRS